MRPSFQRVISPLCSSTFRCFEIAGADTVNGAPSSDTEHEPCASRARISRLMGSDSALKIALRSAGCTSPVKVCHISRGRGTSTMSSFKLTAAARNSDFSWPEIPSLSSVAMA